VTLGLVLISNEGESDVRISDVQVEELDGTQVVGIVLHRIEDGEVVRFASRGFPPAGVSTSSYTAPIAPNGARGDRSQGVIATHQLLVGVRLSDGASGGSAGNVIVHYSSAGRSYSASYPVTIRLCTGDIAAGVEAQHDALTRCSGGAP
jgi:hypothetical protein